MRIALLCVLSLTSCVSNFVTAVVDSYAVVRVGPPRAPNPDGCVVTFSQTAPEELAAGYTRVGNLCLSIKKFTEDDVRPAYSIPEARQALQRDACRLGGDLVTVNGSCFRGVEYAVLRAR